MDPKANIGEQKRLAQEIVTLAESITYRNDEAARTMALIVKLAEELSDLVLALDEWRAGGGYDPYEAEARESWHGVTPPTPAPLLSREEALRRSQLGAERAKRS